MHDRTFHRQVLRSGAASEALQVLRAEVLQELPEARAVRVLRVLQAGVLQEQLRYWCNCS